MVNARQEIELRNRAIQSGELPMPERRDGESDGEWLTRVAAANGNALPAIGDRYVGPKMFRATNANPGPPGPQDIWVSGGEVVVVRDIETVNGELRLRCNIEGDEHQFIYIEPWRLARYAKPCRGPLPAGSVPHSESAGESFEPSSTTP